MKEKKIWYYEFWAEDQRHVEEFDHEPTEAELDEVMDIIIGNLDTGYGELEGERLESYFKEQKRR